ncbi:GTPase HflX [Candidatus Dependentiae bacterium HGW-Dependentiae-1]|nr:MAG: GTPase HflX [Candidatus Dependentiae bacterium HGW-Dependentiae-1]
MPREPFHQTSRHVKTLIVGIHAPANRTKDIQCYYQEFESLVKTRGITPDVILTMRLRETDAAYFVTKGKLEEIAKICEEQQIEEIIFSETLSPQQGRNLSTYLDCTVTDRTKLILDIFERAAQSGEGKMQVAIAQLQYAKTRMAGRGIHLSQQEGSVGLMGGPGETAKEREKRALDLEILKLKKQLAMLQKNRETQRKRRLTAQIPHICLIGYTNAGKSTILNLLTHSNVLAEDKLFATLDTTTRELYVQGKKKGIISDTVGFIQDLPHQLIDAFKSTLSELQYADLLVQVIDIADANWEAHLNVVATILQDLDVVKEMVYVFNKADKLSENELTRMRDAIARYQPQVIVNSHSKEGIKPLLEFLNSWQPTTHAEQSEPLVQLDTDTQK